MSNEMIYWIVVGFILLTLFLIYNIKLYLIDKKIDWIGLMLSTIGCAGFFIIALGISESTPILKNTEEYKYVAYEVKDNSISVSYEDDAAVKHVSIDEDDFTISKSDDTSNYIIITKYGSSVHSVEAKLDEEKYNEIKE